MKLTREDITFATEMIDLSEDDYEVRPAYSGRGMGSQTSLAVVLPDVGKLTELLVALAVSLTEDGRAEDALRLARKTSTDHMGLSIVAYWPGVELAD